MRTAANRRASRTSSHRPGYGQMSAWVWRFASSRGCPAPILDLTGRLIVQPATVVRWHRRGFAWYWSRKSRRIGGRLPLARDLRDLIHSMATANPLWGAPRIHGERLKLGLHISERTVPRLLPTRRRPPLQTWRTLLHNHVGTLVAWTSSRCPRARFVCYSSWCSSPMTADAFSTST